MQSKDGKDKCQPYRCSILSENYNGEPIAFEWKTFPGTTASELLQKNSKDLEGRRIRSESFSDRIVIMSMFKDIDLDKKGLLHDQFEKNSKCMRQDSLTDTGYSWIPEEKASGIKDLQSIVANGNSVLHQLWRNSRSLERSKYYPPQWRVWQHWFSEKHAANQLCIYGAVKKLCEKQPEADFGKASKGRPESARRTPRDIQIKQEERKSLVDFSRLPTASGNRMLQNLENFESMPFMSKIESLRAAAKFHHPIEMENSYVTTLLEDDGWGIHTSMCKEYTAPRNQKDSRPFASIVQTKQIDPFLIIGIALVVDVPGIEVQVPSLSELWRSIWILTCRGKERFVNEIHRHKAGIVNDSS